LNGGWIVVSFDGVDGGAFKGSVVRGRLLYSGLFVLGVGGMSFRGDVVFLGALSFGEVYVPRSSPAWSIFALLCATVSDAIFAFMAARKGAVRVVAAKVGLSRIPFGSFGGR